MYIKMYAVFFILFIEGTLYDKKLGAKRNELITEYGQTDF